VFNLVCIVSHELVQKHLIRFLLRRRWRTWLLHRLSKGTELSTAALGFSTALQTLTSFLATYNFAECIVETLIVIGIDFEILES
jgi:hypothetical protein